MKERHCSTVLLSAFFPPSSIRPTQTTPMGPIEDGKGALYCSIPS